VLSHFASGNYRFLAAPGRPFSSGIVADDGYDLVHATFFRPVPLAEGLEAARRHVEATGRPVAALGAFELRIPAPLSGEGFAEFNKPYVERMTALGLVSDGELVTARTNVAPTLAGVAEPSLHAFTYTVAGRRRERAAFRLSGSTESNREGSGADRLLSIVATLEARMAELSVTWDDATDVAVYGASCAAVDSVVPSCGTAGLRGLTWFPSHPPIVDFAYEIDAMGVGTEIVVDRA
jgi:hypothetical protein